MAEDLHTLTNSHHGRTMYTGSLVLVSYIHRNSSIIQEPGEHFTIHILLVDMGAAK